MTPFIVIATVILLIVYDIYAVIKGGRENTISWFIFSTSLKYPIIPFAAGVLCGHFWFGQGC